MKITRMVTRIEWAILCPLNPGQRVGHYEILSTLGAGGMGVVYLARDTTLRREVAIKMLGGAEAADEALQRRLLHEARTASALNHPNICVIHEAGETDGRGYIVMEYIAGRTLSSLLTEGSLMADVALRYGAQIADALGHAHERGFIHRDLKSANVMVTAEGRVKLLDFGLAVLTPEAAVEEVTLSVADAGRYGMAGTMRYMAPETLRGDPPGVPADIWALGVVLYEMTAGRLPFSGKTAYELNSAIVRDPHPPLPETVPGSLRATIDRCLQKDPAQRYGRASEAKAVLESGSQQAISTPVTSTIAVSAARPGRYRRLLWAAAGLAIVAAGATMLSLGRGRSHAPPSAISSPAYDLYTQGVYYATQEGKPGSDKAISLLEQAVSRDPNFAQAHAQLAYAYVRRAFYVEPGDPQWQGKAYAAIQKALALDPKSGEAHLARGMFLWSPAQHFLHSDAIMEFRTAMALAPNLDEAHHQLGLVYIHTGLLKQGQAELEQASKINPLNAMARHRVGVALMYQGDYANALTYLAGTSDEFSPSLVAYQKAWCEFHLGHKTPARKAVDAFLRQHPEDQSGLLTSTKAVLLAEEGQLEEARKAIDDAAAHERGFGHFHHSAFNVACAYSLLGEPSKAVEWLRQASDDGLPNYVLFSKEPLFSRMKDDPGFVALLGELKKRQESFAAQAAMPLPEIQ